MQRHNVQEFNLTEARLFEQNIVGKIENVRHAFNKIQNTVESSQSWWKGGSEREFINDFMRTRTEMERFLKAWLEEYREIMNQVAAGYVEDEEYLKSDIMKQAFRDFEMSLGVTGASPANVTRSGAGKIPSIKVTGVTREDLEMKKLALDEAEYNLRQAEANYKKNPSHNYMLALAAAGSAYTTAETQYDSVNKAWIKQNEDAWTDWNVYETEPFNIYNEIRSEERLAEIKANPVPNTDNQFYTLADFNSFWYTDTTFNISNKPQCPWYAIGRIAETNDGAKITFNGTGSGGYWVQNANEKAYIYDTNGEKTNGYRIVETEPNPYNIKPNGDRIVETESNPYNIKPNSVVSFQFYVNTTNAEGWHGHVMYIEHVEVIDGKTFVYYSDSNAGFDEGTIRVKEIDEFIHMFDYDINGRLRQPKPPDEMLFQGYVKLSDEIYYD